MSIVHVGEREGISEKQTGSAMEQIEICIFI
jgi:hypothetical protein